MVVFSVDSLVDDETLQKVSDAVGAKFIKAVHIG